MFTFCFSNNASILFMISLLSFFYGLIMLFLFPCYFQITKCAIKIIELLRNIWRYNADNEIPENKEL